MVVPMFHGRRLRSYEHIIEEEVMREVATWPEGREFETLPPMTRIALSSILRATFGVDGLGLDELHDLCKRSLRCSAGPLVPPRMRRDLGPWSPWGRYLRYRRRFDAAVDSLIADARADPALEGRSDVLALLVQARYEDGEPLPDRHIADELLTLLASGHETTASSLAWAVERLSRHPQLLSRLTEEVDAGRIRIAAGHDLGCTQVPAVLRPAIRRRARDADVPANCNAGGFRNRIYHFTKD